MTDDIFMRRCLELAARGAGRVAPNPMVGSVLVCDGVIIGEGYHQQYGQAHAERNCIDSVAKPDLDLIRKSTMYVSLEPCAHFGKTPPCANLIIEKKIPKVIIGCRDPFSEVNGKGIEKLQNAGINVVSGILETECRQINKRFFVFHEHHRPYIILKWAQTADGKIAGNNNKRLLISNEFSNRIVHKWRSEESSILIGTNTAAFDDPELTTRLWAGKNATRIVLDMNLRLPSSLKVFNDQARTIVFNKIRHEEGDHLFFYKVTEGMHLVPQIVTALHDLKILSVIVEGGRQLTQSFIDASLWDEARVITNQLIISPGGLAAPGLSSCKKVNHVDLESDKIEIFEPVTEKLLMRP